MDLLDVIPSIEELNENIDSLNKTLEPLLRSTLSNTAGKLPLLDRAKLYVVVTYSIESLLFCKFSLHMGLFQKFNREHHNPMKSKQQDF